jgi:hypothetical protein
VTSPIDPMIDWTDKPRKYGPLMNELDRRISVAPMMDWTDNQISYDGSIGYEVLKTSQPLRSLNFGISGALMSSGTARYRARATSALAPLDPACPTASPTGSFTRPL